MDTATEKRLNENVTEYLKRNKEAIEKAVESSLIKHYIDKATGGKYVEKVKKCFGVLTDEQLIKLGEALKTIPIKGKQRPEFLEKIAKWSKDYPDSAPIKKIKKNIEFVESLFADKNISNDEEFSAGAIVQAFQEKFATIAFGNMYVVPLAQSFHYTRTQYMVWPAEVAIQYMGKRNSICLNLLAAMVNAKIVTTDELLDHDLQTLSTDMYSRLSKAETRKVLDAVEADPEEIDEPLFEIDVGKLDIAQMIAGAYVVEHRWVMQNESFRRGEIKVSQLKKICRFCNLILKAFGKDPLPATVSLVPKNKDDLPQWWINLYQCFKGLSRLAKTLRRISSGGVGQTTTAKKNYSAFDVDNAEAEEEEKKEAPKAETPKKKKGNAKKEEK